MTKLTWALCAFAGVGLAASTSRAEVRPYTGTEANTLHLYHFNEADTVSPQQFNDVVGTLHLGRTRASSVPASMSCGPAI